MNRRSLIGTTAFLPFLWGRRQTLHVQSTPIADESDVNGVRMIATWVDDRSKPTLRLHTAITWYSYPLQARGVFQTWQEQPEDWFQEVFDADGIRTLASAELVLPPVGDPPRYDVAYRVRQGQRTGPCLISCLGHVLIEQATIAFSGLRFGEGDMNTPADEAMFGPLERLTDSGGDIGLADLSSLMPKEDELAHAGLDIKIREEYQEY